MAIAGNKNIAIRQKNQVGGQVVPRGGSLQTSHRHSRRVEIRLKVACQVARKKDDQVDGKTEAYVSERVGDVIDSWRASGLVMCR